MKTVTTLTLFLLFATAVVAADKNPSVFIKSTGKYLIVVDGKRFENKRQIAVHKLKKGVHYIDVFERRKGLFGKKYKLVSSKQFVVNNKEVQIRIDHNGYIDLGRHKDGWEGDFWWRNRNNRS